MSEGQPAVAIVIPTWKNRASLWLRQATYYANVGHTETVYVGDSSEYDEPEQLMEAVGRLASRANINYTRLPGLGDTEAISALLHSAGEPYAAFCGDDDFLVPTSLRKCAEFLERNKEYSTVHGLGAMCIVEPNGSFDRVRAVGRYAIRSSVQSNASERLKDYLASYFVTLFSVHRTQEFRSDIDQALAIPDRHFRELLPGCLSVVRGKVKLLDCLYLLRTEHDLRFSPVDRMDWVAGSDWARSYGIFRDVLADAVAQEDGLSRDESREIVKQAFWPYLSQTLSKGFPVANPKPVERFKQIFRAAPGAMTAWRSMRPFLPGGRGQLTLNSLMRPASPYHQDFMPIYQVITEMATPQVAPVA